MNFLKNIPNVLNSKIKAITKYEIPNQGKLITF